MQKTPDLNILTREGEGREKERERQEKYTVRSKYFQSIITNPFKIKKKKKRKKRKKKKEKDEPKIKPP